jgi:poly-beta-hydroxybutyrate-responsive repressor
MVKPSILMLLKDRRAHGYALLEQVEELGVAAIDAGGFYRLLRDLEQAKLVRSRWEAQGSGPARRVYELTPKGEEELAAWGAALRRQHALMSSYLRRFRGAVGRDG